VSILCRIGWHEWGTFKFLFPVNILSAYGGSIPVKELRVYEARCNRCGNVRIKKLSV
jgi:hypothetical protein